MTATTVTSCNRRTALTAAASAACVFALSACGGGDDSTGAADPGGDGSSDPGAEDPNADDPGTNGGGDSEGGGDGDGAGQPVATLAEVPVGEATAFTTPDGENALLFRSDETTVAAYSAVCTHQGGSLQPDGAELRCPLHNSVFDAATGEVLSGPASDALPAVGVRIEGERIVTG
jgi:nitrite reductase/ring-hydroxylating ferredoxin subunit